MATLTKKPLTQPKIGTAATTTTPAAIPYSAPMTQFSNFGPDKNLIGQQISPTTDPRLRRMQGLTNQAALSLSSAPNLQEAALQRFEGLRSASEPQYQQALQDVGRRAASLGRVGAGMTTSELGDLTLQREKYLGDVQKQLAGETAMQEESNRLARLYGLSGLEGQLYGQGAGERSELRGERDYQYGLERQGLEDQIRQRLMEESLTQGQWGRQMGLAGLAGQYGYGGGQSYPELMAASLKGQQAERGLSGITDLFGMLGQSSQKKQLAPVPTRTTGKAPSLYTGQGY